MQKKRVKQSTLNFILGGSSIILSVILVILSIQVISSFEKMKVAEQRKLEFRQLGFDLSNASDYLTNEVRAYVQFGDKVHYDNYWKEVNETKTRDKVVARLKELGAPQNELDLLAEAKKKSDVLVATEDKAMKAAAEGNFDKARHLVYDDQYDKDKEIIKEPITRFQETMNARAAKEQDQATHTTQTYIVIIIILIIFTALFSSISLLLSHFKIIRPIIKIKDNMMAVARGDLSQHVSIAGDSSEMGQLAMATTTVIQTLQNLINEMTDLSKAHDAGDIDVFVPEDKFQGAYKDMAKGVNDMVIGHISVNKKAMACVAEFVKGNFNAELERFPGKKAFINDNIEALRKNLKDVNNEIVKLITASNEGKLSERADTGIFQGDWASLMLGLNGLIDAIIEPVQEAAAVLDEMSKGNLQVNVKGNYKGDHAKIKNALNDTISTLSSYVSEISGTLTEMANGNMVVGITKDYRGNFSEIRDSLNNIIKAFNEVLNDINNAASQVAEGSRQMSDSAQALSQGATEQASAIEELTASIEEISAQTKQNAEYANQANGLTETAKTNAEQGNAQMKEMLKAMQGINDASANISKIIKVIDEIAFQTNILALNAAVEAARAGQHGKGFAVVAEEVRNLAARSANAAKETTDMIESSIKKVEGGTRIANETANALTQIVEGVAKVAGLVNGIAVASNEQAAGISQINQGVMQVSHVVQTNSATSEESAAASEELSSQAELLKEQVGRFKLKRESQSTYARGLEDFNPDVLQMLETMNKNKRVSGNATEEKHTGEAIARSRKIALSDSEFGKY